MFNILIGKSHKHKYVKCSNCKIIDSISPLYSHPICQLCHQPLKEISEEEYKQEMAYKKYVKIQFQLKYIYIIRLMVLLKNGEE